MATPSTLKTLIEISDKEIDQAKLNLAEALRVVQEMEQKLVMLQQYQHDYASRFQAGSSAGGLTIDSLRNTQSFLEKLELAVSGQNELLRHARTKAERAQLSWQNATRKQKSFSTLAARATSSELKQQGKREQRQTDEHASRQNTTHPHRSGHSS